jgi:hypothetical protein
MDSDPQPTSATAAQSPASPVQSLVQYIEANPAAAVIQALAIGFAVGLLTRLIEKGDPAPAIDLKRKPTLDDAKFHLGSLVLPFLYPAWQKAQETYGKSADTILHAVDKAKHTDLPSKGKKHIEKAESWAAAEAARLAKTGTKHLQDAEDWAATEAANLAKTGKKQAQAIEQWLEQEILPAAESGWKKLRKLLR